MKTPSDIIKDHIVTLSWDEIREIRNFCDRTMRIKYKDIQQKKRLGKIKTENYE